MSMTMYACTHTDCTQHSGPWITFRKHSFNYLQFALQRMCTSQMYSFTSVLELIITGLLLQCTMICELSYIALSLSLSLMLHTHTHTHTISSSAWYEVLDHHEPEILHFLLLETCIHAYTHYHAVLHLSSFHTDSCMCMYSYIRMSS